MSAAFFQTTRALQGDRGRTGTVVVVAAALVLGGWVVWAFTSRLAVVELSASARLEVRGAVHPVAAQVGGRVVAVHLPLGARVDAGQVLVELDAESQRRELATSQRRLEALGPELAAIDAQLHALASVRAQGQRHLGATLRVAQSRMSEEALRASHAEREAALQAGLREAHGASTVQAQRALETAETQRAELQTRALESAAAASAGRVEDSLRSADEARLQRDRAALAAEQTTLKARAELLAYEVERRRVRAPIGGTLGRVSELAIGAVIAEGAELGMVVPDGELHAVADFAAASGLGRLAPGQAATIRFDGFPWSQFGVLPAKVRTVSSEVRDGRMRVELALGSREGCRVPLRHGMSGSIAVDVEHVSPAELVLRAAGAAFGAAAR